MSTETRVIFSESRSPVANLAMEELLLDSVEDGREILFLYENGPAVVIGRFQNPWKECRTGLAARSGVPVYRRVSGGGTVVHGPGNLNFSVISGKRLPDKAGNLDRIVSALGGLGVTIFRNERFDLRIPGGECGGGGGIPDFKVSGSAFRQTSRASMHHGTLLVNADLGALKFLLRQPPREMEVKGIASVPSPVANLEDAVPGLTTDAVADAIARAWGGSPETPDPGAVDGPVFREAAGRLASEEWIWDKTPKFRETFRNLPGYGDGALVLEVCGGRVSGPPASAGFLEGSRYRGDALLSAGKGLELSWLGELSRRVDGDGGQRV